jgi:hypothetical protein
MFLNNDCRMVIKDGLKMIPTKTILPISRKLLISFNNKYFRLYILDYKLDMYFVDY